MFMIHIDCMLAATATLFVFQFGQLLTRNERTFVKMMEMWNKSKPRQVAAIYLEDVVEGFKNTYGPVPRELDRWVIADDTWKESKRKYITGDGTSFAFIEPMKAGIANMRVNKK